MALAIADLEPSLSLGKHRAVLKRRTKDSSYFAWICGTIGLGVCKKEVTRGEAI